jgi:hypothetical protein
MVIVVLYITFFEKKLRRIALSIPTCDFEKTFSANKTVLKHVRVQVWVICGDDSGPGVKPVATNA